MRPYLKLIPLLLIPLAFVVWYALSSVEIGSGDYVLEKADVSWLKEHLARETSPRQPTDIAHRAGAIIIADTAAVADADSVTSALNEATDSAMTHKDATVRPLHVAPGDSTKFRILFFGDSMLEGLGRRCADYTTQSGYDLTTVIWYSSSTKLWAETDTLEFLLERINPDYVLLCLGSNELFVRDLAKRDRYISMLVEKLAGRPFVWISPPNWKPDTGINDLIIKNVGRGRYFDSRDLQLERGPDNAHPTHTAAAAWMDTIARWLNTQQPDTPLPLEAPTGEMSRHYHQYVLKPVL